jgi:transposase
MSDIARFYEIRPSLLQKIYREKLSNFSNWDQKAHAEEYLLYAHNIGPFLSIDEVSLSKGELYTYVTNKEAHGKKGTLVASIRGTLSKDIVDVLLKIPIELRNTVKEVTLDMANNMSLSIEQAFPNANKTIDRFHVIKLAMEALQHKRIKERWKAMDEENKSIAKAKKEKVKYVAETFDNGDTPKQLLSRSRYIIAKKPGQWTRTQKERADILFKNYTQIKIAFKHVLHLRAIYLIRDRDIAKRNFLHWIERTQKLGIDEFNTVANTIANKLESILNFFNHRNTNANAESFNAKIKLFRANLRGVTNTAFFLYRLEKLYA